MIFVDTHAHLYLKEFEQDIDATIRRAIEKGVKYMLIPNIDSSSVDSLHRICNRFPGICYPMMGLHPTSVKNNYKDELKVMEEQFKIHSFVAAGEIGIDLYWDKTHFEEQKYAFFCQMDLAMKYDLPVVIHSRNSLDIILKMMNDKKYTGIRGVFHCFPGSYEQAKKVADMGLYLGIGGVVTYSKSTMAEVTARMPLDCILLETDAPFLTPHPHRGKRNECAFIGDIAMKISEIKGIPVETVAQATTKNAFELFRLENYYPS